MSQNSRQASRHEYNKPQLKAQIEAAMARFLETGRAVEHVPAAMPAAPLAPSAEGLALPPATGAAATAAAADAPPPEAGAEPEAEA